mmetsp:Transcript_267/g.471  ORF Transcript_267/g.471 Transcript_267/m.471 type:complete len:286 (-) Transcript_267:277-1134(-)
MLRENERAPLDPILFLYRLVLKYVDNITRLDEVLIVEVVGGRVIELVELEEVLLDEGAEPLIELFDAVESTELFADGDIEFSPLYLYRHLVPLASLELLLVGVEGVLEHDGDAEVVVELEVEVLLLPDHLLQVEHDRGGLLLTLANLLGPHRKVSSGVLVKALVYKVHKLVVALNFFHHLLPLLLVAEPVAVEHVLAHAKLVVFSQLVVYLIDRVLIDLERVKKPALFVKLALILSVRVDLGLAETVERPDIVLVLSQLIAVVLDLIHGFQLLHFERLLEVEALL